jgi:hypothetical protein
MAAVLTVVKQLLLLQLVVLVLLLSPVVAMAVAVVVLRGLLLLQLVVLVLLLSPVVAMAVAVVVLRGLLLLQLVVLVPLPLVMAKVGAAKKAVEKCGAIGGSGPTPQVDSRRAAGLRSHYLPYLSSHCKAEGK